MNITANESSTKMVHLDYVLPEKTLKYTQIFILPILTLLLWS